MTTFQTPLKTRGLAGDTGNPQTDTTGFVRSTKVVSLGATGTNITRAIITLPDKSTLLGLSAVPTSAFAADVSALVVSFGNSADATHYGVIAVSAVGQLRASAVSAATEFDAYSATNPNTIILTASAVSTTTFTAGGVRAFVDYVTAE